MLQELSRNDKWDVGTLKYPFGNGINFQLEVENLDEIYNNFLNSGFKVILRDENRTKEETLILVEKLFKLKKRWFKKNKNKKRKG